MNGFRDFFFVLFLGINAILYAQQGHLIIAGGGLQEDNSEVFNEIVRLSGGRSAIIGIIPAASGSPVQSYMAFKKILMKYGLEENQILLIRIASEDDNVTEEDESLWMNNAYDSSTCRLIQECKGIWFSGGDQMRVTRAFLTLEGKDTPALKAIRSVLSRGGMVGGTSAGAAIQSQVMIGGGSSMGALMYGIANIYSEEEVDGRGKLFLTQGLGFFPEGVVDQHFDRRARLGRLAMALFEYSDKYSLGFGIDENTALIYNLKSRFITVKGKGGVSLLDISSARYQKKGDMPCLQNMGLSYLTVGDSLKLGSMQFIPAKNKLKVTGSENYQITELPYTGLLSGTGFTLMDFISVYLIDNKSLDTISTITFNSQGLGFKKELRKVKITEGFMADLPDDEKYSFYGVRLDIIPIQVEIKEL
ncbi:MAG: hypothetical protein PWR20_1524 [Bacteroidales bacterium]|jgi:cyanophycinase|nr:hypothetical protein [Bacteroidales bacterium]MDN5330520.1 hypothetical protein [Bacteroidales bacterium]